MNVLTITAPGVNTAAVNDSFAVQAAEDLVDAAFILKHHEFDAVVTDSVALVGRLRSQGNRVPVLGLTQSPAARSRVDMLMAGADDCVSLPSDPTETVARLNCIIRRAAGQASDRYQVGDITIDPSHRTVTHAGRVVSLTAKEFAVLHLLARRVGRVVTKEQFLAEMYGGRDEAEIKIVDVFIHKVRRKLASIGATGLIETKWGNGYTLIQKDSHHEAA